ncbi:MAG: M23 family metallopeptidase [Ignavibacteria bacterium]|nr:M23 family metallopeptidase [Ignavibacteria bacterium]
MTTQVLIGKVIGVFKSVNLKQVMSFIGRFRFSVTVVPEGTSYIKAKTYSFLKLALFLWVFGTFSAIITGILMVYTPINRLFFNQSFQLSHYQVEQLKKLDGQIKGLSREVEGLREDNQKLENAIMLADTNALNGYKRRAQQQQNAARVKNGGGSIADMVEYLLNAIHDISADRDQQKAGAAKSMDIRFRRPCDGFISNHFRPSEGHLGIDFSLNIRTPVYASANGYVVFADYTANDGNMIVIVHADGYISVYKHCFQLVKQVRARVMQGELIALSGNTGRLTTGPHLHFELWQNGVCIDPEQYLSE